MIKKKANPKFHNTPATKIMAFDGTTTMMVASNTIRVMLHTN